MMKLAVIALLVAYVSAETYEEHGIRMGYLEEQRWESGINEHFRGWNMENVRATLGAKLDVHTRNPTMKPAYLEAMESGATPYSATSWNISANWPVCAATFGHIKDQADCGSCWAVAASEVIEDRTCIHNIGKLAAGTIIEFSAENIMSCCDWCGDGCQGGYPIDAMRFWNWNGVPTGGQFGSNCGCQPYMIPPCPSSGCSGPIAQTPACSKSCINGYQFTTASSDDHFGSDAYMISNNVQKLQDEIYNHGTIECAFTVHTPFLYYKGGVYNNCGGPVDGGHAISIVGWGHDQPSNQDYWLVKNSWNQSWGLGGYIKFLRGVDLCGIESQCVAGIPKGAANSDQHVQLSCAH